MYKDNTTPRLKLNTKTNKRIPVEVAAGAASDAVPLAQRRREGETLHVAKVSQRGGRRAARGRRHSSGRHGRHVLDRHGHVLGAHAGVWRIVRHQRVLALHQLRAIGRQRRERERERERERRGRGGGGRTKKKKKEKPVNGQVEK